MQKVRSRVGEGDNEHDEQQFLRDAGHTGVVTKSLPEDFEDHGIARHDRNKLGMPVERWVETWAHFVAEDAKNFDQENASDVGVKEGISFQERRPETTE